MPTASGHTSAILASKVKGTNIYNTAGDKIGHVEDIVLDKTSNKIMFAVAGFGGFLGMGESYHPIPWSVLDYSTDKDGYIVPMTKEQLEQAPTTRLEDVTRNEGPLRDQSYTYYKTQPDW